MIKFNKKEQAKLIDKIHTSLINNDLKCLMSTFMTMSEFSSFFATLKIDKDIKEERKSSRAAAKKSASDLLNYIHSNINDFSESEIEDVNIDTDYYAKEISNVFPIATFRIVFKTSKTYLKIGISNVISIKRRLCWMGGGISYVANQEPFEKKAHKESKLKELKLQGKFEEVEMTESKFSSLPHIVHAHKKARVYNSLKVDGNLDLDQLYQEGIYTLIVKQDLTVSGDIININSNTGSSLFVLGKTSSSNIIAGGSIISLNEANIKDFTIGFYNDGYLSINQLSTDILLSFDHHTVIEDKTKISIYLDSYLNTIDTKGYLSDIGMLAKYLYDTKKFSNMVTKEEDDEEFYYFEDDVLIKVIIDKQYTLIQETIYFFFRSHVKGLNCRK